jgi:hypothetical protein
LGGCACRRHAVRGCWHCARHQWRLDPGRNSTTSDITYRHYDYGRPRELHVAEVLAATRLYSNAGKVVRRAGDAPDVLVRSPYFQVERIKLGAPLRAEVSPTSPQMLLAIDGVGMVASHSMEPISFATGEAVVVPAVLERPQRELELMRISLPTGAASEPETRQEIAIGH